MSTNKIRLQQLRGYGKGRTAWIVGNGPTLRKSPLRMLHEMGEHTFAVNRIAQIYPETAWRPTFYSCTLLDITGYGDKIEFTIDILTAIKEAPRAFVGEWLQHQVGQPDNVYWLKEYNPLPTHIREINRHPYYSRNITEGVNLARSLIVPVQLSDFMGYDPIVLLGCDGKYLPGHIHNHMTKDYVAFSDLEAEWDVDRENELQREMHKIIRQSNPKVVNGTAGGFVENYPRVDPYEILGVDPDPAREGLW